MNELDLYKFIQKTGTEIKWRGKELIILLNPSDIADFAEMVGWEYLLSDGGLQCNMKIKGYIALDIVELCENFDIDPERILERNK